MSKSKRFDAASVRTWARSTRRRKSGRVLKSNPAHASYSSTRREVNIDKEEGFRGDLGKVYSGTESNRDSIF